MIQTQTLQINGRTFIRTWSDANRYVVRDGVEYSEAVDPAEFGRTYTEGGIMPVDEWQDEYAAAGKILLGEGE